jgi:peptidyl-prolyl cis-trans isomerase D
VGRQPQEGEGALGQGVMEGLFGQGRGQVFSGQADDEGNFVVGVVDRVVPPVAAVVGRQAEEVRMPLTAQAFQQEILPAIQAGARVEVDVRTDPDRAALALGVTPPAADEEAEVELAADAAQ